MRKSLLFLFLSVMLAILPGLAASQTLSPKWARGATSTAIHYSVDGSKVWQYDGYGFRVFSTSTHQLIASVGVAAQSAVLSNDGQGFYFLSSAPNQIYYYSFASKSAVLIRTDQANYGYGYLPALSTDGSQLALKSFNASTSRNVIEVVTLSSGATTRFALPSGVDTNQIDFVNGNTRLMLGGGRLYTTAGTLVATRLSPTSSTFCVSPDRTKVFIRDDNSDLVALNATGTLNQLWLTHVSNPYDVDLDCTQGGNTVIDLEYDSNLAVYAVKSYSTATGTQLAGAVTLGTWYQLGLLRCSPVANEFTIFAIDANGGALRRYSIDPATGNGAQMSNLSEGLTNSGTPVQAFGTGANQFFGNYDNFTSLTDMRNSNTGDLTGTARYTAVISPDGNYFVWVGNREGDSAYGAHVYRVSDGTRIASYLSGDASSAGWAADSGAIWIYRTVGKCRVMSFNGTTLSLLKEVSGVSGGEFYVTADKSKLINRIGNDAGVYSLSSGALLGTMHGDASYTGVLSANLCGTRFGMFAWQVSGSTYRALYQFFDLTQAAFPVVANVYYDSATPPGAYGFAAPSADTSTVSFGAFTFGDANGLQHCRLQVRRTGDNALLAQYDDQFYDSYGLSSVANVSKDNATLFYSTAAYSYMVGVDLPAVLTGVSVSPTSVVGGNASTGTVTISRPAPVGGTTVTLSASSGVSVPASVTITEGNTSATFSAGTSGVDTTTNKTITATLDGYGLNTTLTITPASVLSLSFSPTSVSAGSTSTGTVTLNGQAGPSGTVVNLSSNQTFVTVPATTPVAANQTSGTFTANTSDPGTTASATVTATFGASNATADLEVTSASGFSVSFNKGSVKGGNALRLTVSLDNPAPVGGTSFTLAGNSLTSPPASVTVPEGQTSATVTVGTSPTPVDANGIVTVTLGASSKDATALVLAPVVKSVSLSASEVSGPTTVMMLVVLDGVAPANMQFTASSNNPNVKFPASTVTVPGGAFYTVVTITVKKVTEVKTAFLKVSDKQAKFIVQP